MSVLTRSERAIFQWSNPKIRKKMIKGLKDSWNHRRKKAQSVRMRENNPMHKQENINKMSRSLKNSYRNGEIEVWNKNVKSECQPFFNRKHSKVTKNKIKKSNIKTRSSKSQIIKSRKITKKLWEDQNYRTKVSKKIRESWTDQRRKKRSEERKDWWEKNDDIKRDIIKSLLKRPTKAESHITSLIRDNKLPFKYTGDGEFFIGRKNPDFKHITKKKVIEFNGFYTHTPEEELKRRSYMKDRGFEVMFLHYEDLQNEPKMLDKIREFGGEI